MSLEQFHWATSRGQEGWSGEWAEDTLVLNIGRTFRTGPPPGYLAVWYTPAAGLERIGDWERIFKSGEADHVEEPFKLAARIDAAGCYDPLIEPVPARGRLYYAEYFDVAEGASRDEVIAAFERRRDADPALDLHLLVDRIGHLGPNPRGLAVWGMDSWAPLDRAARELWDDGPARLVDAGLYRDLGEETL